ncbi:MAG: hypothetical protein QNJ12_17685 [Ilumatobacter sp.]|uniref:PQQ-dependent sugar dehydrogenase n=1 Tax=Ilumatobacter sp. TaxID=1967498 RepID=UPI002611A9C9|nr:hypothetical protein [Ilumatobacter sp.]MDJ0770630.1 hypothetical protein [Ilumatobacter sp.]
MRSFAVALALLLVSCGDDGPRDAQLELSVVADGFEGPTQIAIAPDGRLLVAELNGGERDGTGRVAAVDLDDPDRREVLVDGLLTPTGLAVADGRLWIMEQRRLTVGPLGGGTDRTVVLDALPFNGRSQGTITPLADGSILYDTSGRREGDGLASGSGTLWTLTGPDAAPVAYATGFKHAYAHVVGPDDRLWVTEMSDGRLDGTVPPDELVEVMVDDDFGYPRCVGDRIPVAELGATDATCTDTPRSHAIFPAGATPTSVVVAPWDPGTLLVALWNRGEIVAVPIAADGRPHAGEVLIDTVERPQHLLVAGDRVLVTDHATGRVVAITPR